MQVELLDKGYEVGIYQTAFLMKRAQVVAIRPQKKHYYADTGKEQKYFPNLLNRQFSPKTANTYWVGDITYGAPSLRWRH